MSVASFDRLPAAEGWRVVQPSPPKAKADTPVTVSVKRRTSGLVLTISISDQVFSGLGEPASISVSENTSENALMLQKHTGEASEAFPVGRVGKIGKAPRRQISLLAWHKMVATDKPVAANSGLISWKGQPTLVIRLPLAVLEARRPVR
ncbi:hypothetical protein PbB2_00071 [Candidatus Phycosocius bacilliformis]|uniref:Uncharacterized protein n=1 Tax=Candidatus Phycosocius bacilliformis TaxID=1445552 RepID=A0A2P2E5S2_9PROT|nr:hypothetical protein [Candidatus Phycosocius bacilliformis]GBF56415.1 hypothetical protein PbB2_00071 [Candidatus Phycosocius bacilliformis]